MEKKLKYNIFITRLRPYFSIAGLYILILLVLKLVEFFLIDIDAAKRGQILVNALVYNLIVASWTILGMGVVYYLVQLLSSRAAKVLSSIIFALLLLTETGLLFYSLHNGFLLGCELAARPLSESWMAIRGAVGVVLPIVLPILIVGGFVSLSLWCSDKPSRVVMAVPVVVVVFALMSLVFKTSNLMSKQYNHFILNKSHYFYVECYYYFHLLGHSDDLTDGTTVEYDKSMTAELLATHPEWGTPIDSTYPLERQFTPDHFLDTYFKDIKPGNSAPSIVIILVESLGHEYMGTGAMPFVDSLAATGLYWSNCLSATTRSYGAMPAITGSVGGPKSFQFGTMPAHNTLITLLRHANYNTRAYYAGDFTFDCIYEYLTAQRTDYLSPLYSEYKNLPPSEQTSPWGYNDDTLFVSAIRDLNRNLGSGVRPHLTLITTLSMHEKLRLSNPSVQADYERRTRKLRAPNSRVAESFPAALFTDDCLRRFIHAYSRRADFDNTLFVIVGDHASGRQGGDHLAYHHVPLILWSPLVQQPRHFRHIVTHNDIAPALYSLLTGRYGLQAQPTVHWLGDGLGPSPKTLLVVNYDHEITDIIYHDHYYQTATHFGPEEFYSIGSDMKLAPSNDQQALTDCRRQIDLMRYLYAYTYYRNRLTSSPVYSKQYNTMQCIRISKPIDCINPEEPPSKVGCVDYPILPALQLNGTEGYTSVRIALEADVTLHDELQVEQFPNLCIKFEGNQSIHEFERISKFLLGNPCYTAGTFHLSLTKEFSLGGISPMISLAVTTPWDESDWRPNIHVTVSNILVTISYAR